MSPPQSPPTLADLQASINTLTTAVAKLQNPPFLSRNGLGGTSSQVVGNGSAQVVSPSFSAATIGFTGLKIDETGITLANGKHIAAPWFNKGTPMAKTSDLSKLDEGLKALITRTGETATADATKTASAALTARIGAVRGGSVAEAIDAQDALFTRRIGLSGSTTVGTAISTLRQTLLDKIGNVGSASVALALTGIRDRLTTETDARVAFQEQTAEKFLAMKAATGTAAGRLTRASGNIAANEADGADFDATKAQLKALETAVQQLADAIG